jgi:methyl-accepting chemotaxis protein
VANINDKIDELAQGIDELKTTAEELANETLTERDRDHAEDVHEALEEASDASDKMVNDEE